jgi:hypothetical protein
MADIEVVQAENAQLRQQLEAYRLRELETLKTQLAEAKAEAVHYRGEAQRNADLGHKIYAEQQTEIDRLRIRLQTLEQLPNARPTINR